uniref:Uncharacterized protein n=1 Tax=viral metagenome TaxID=1070528 RepID=A0A6C0JPG7_9ZZZZ
MNLQYESRLSIKKSIYKLIFKNKIDSIIDFSNHKETDYDYHSLRTKFKQLVNELPLPKHIKDDLIYKTPLTILNKEDGIRSLSGFTFNKDNEYYENCIDLYMFNEYLLYCDELISYCEVMRIPDYFVINNKYGRNIDFENIKSVKLLIETKCLCIVHSNDIIYTYAGSGEYKTCEDTILAGACVGIFQKLASKMYGGFIFKGEDCKSLKTIFKLFKKIDFCGCVKECTRISVKNIYDKKILFLHTNPENG